MDRPQKGHSSTEYKFPMISTVAPTLANLVLIIGVFFWDWNIGHILLLYWIELPIIVLFTHRMAAVRGMPVEKWVGDEPRAWVLLFLGHGFFGCIFGGLIYGVVLAAGWTVLISPAFFVALAAMVVSCGVQTSAKFKRNPEKAANVLDSLFDRILVLFWVLPGGVFVWLGLVICCGLR